MNNKKFFNSSLPHHCEYCTEARPISGGQEYFCMKNGIVDPFDSCKKYRYDPLKRRPENRSFGQDYNPDDLKLQ